MSNERCKDDGKTVGCFVGSVFGGFFVPKDAQLLWMYSPVIGGSFDPSSLEDKPDGD